jgi:hypothetical protein
MQYHPYQALCVTKHLVFRLVTVGNVVIPLGAVIVEA